MRTDLSRERIAEALERSGGFVHAAARALGCARLTLVRRLRRDPALATAAAERRAAAGYRCGRPKVTHLESAHKNIDTNKTNSLAIPTRVHPKRGATPMLNRPFFDRRRAARGLSLERLALAAEISVSYTAQIARGVVPAAGVRERVAHALGVQPAELWVIPKALDDEAA